MNNLIVLAGAVLFGLMAFEYNSVLAGIACFIFIMGLRVDSND